MEVWYFLLSLMALCSTSCEQVSHYHPCDEYCSLGSKIICMTIYQEYKGFYDAQSICQMDNSVLLPNNLYKDIQKCVDSYLTEYNIPRVWLAIDIGWSTPGLTGHFTTELENEERYFICVRQEKTFKTFSLTVKRNSSSEVTDYDLLSFTWSTEKVFKEVSKGQTLTLTCEAEGIPLPRMMFKINGSFIRRITGNKTSHSIPADKCGDLGTFSCEEEDGNLDRSIAITVSCEHQKPSDEDDYMLIFCSGEEVPYTGVNVVKLHGTQLLATEKISNTFVAKVKQSCDVIRTYKCMVSLKDGTTRNITRYIGIDNCIPKLCRGEDVVKTISTTYGRKPFSFCVIAYPNISDFLIFNNSYVPKNTDNNLNWSSTFSTFNITIIINNKTHVTRGELNTGVYTSQGRDYRLNNPVNIIGESKHTNSSQIDDYKLIHCSAENMPYTDVKVMKLHGENILPTEVINSSIVAKVSKSCDAMGTYMCMVSLKDGTTRNLTRNIGIDNCSPQLCPGEDNVKIISATFGSKSVSFCVFAYPHISDYLIFNDSDVFRNTDNNFDWNYEHCGAFSSYNVTIIINNPTNVTSGELIIGVCTTQGREHRLNYTVILNMLKKQGSQDLITFEPTTITSRYDSLSMTINMGLATVAIVMATCSITCFVLGVIVYRKREKKHKTNRIHEAAYLSICSSVTDVELTTVKAPNWHANVNPDLQADYTYEEVAYCENE